MNHPHSTLSFLSCAGLLMLACSPSNEHNTSDAVAIAREDAAARAVQDSVNRAQPGYIVDSILPADEALRRFREGRPATTALRNGAPSHAELVRRWVAALEKSDSSALLQLSIDRDEFAWIIYPLSPNAVPPFYSPPAFAWDLLQHPSRQGHRRTLDRLGGTPLGFVKFVCPGSVRKFKDLSVWQDCGIIRRLGSGDTITQTLFGPIVEYRGQFKFLTLSSDF